MKRMNFPGRKTRRSEEAASRAEKHAKLTKEQKLAKAGKKEKEKING
jgi:hypothetical protein